MRYFIGYLIQGEAGEWHYTLAKEISEKSNTWKIYKKIPPHITVFRPFDAADVSPVKNLLREWTAGRLIPGDFTLSGFGCFEDEVVFAVVNTERPVLNTVIDLQKKLHALPGMPPSEYKEWHPHATLANHFESSQFFKIWQYVSALPKPHFVLPFDDVTLFYYDESKTWRVDEMFHLKKMH